MANPDLQIKGWGGGWGGVHPDPEIAVGGCMKKHFFSALQASVRSKNKVGGGEAGSPGPLPWISTRKTNLLLFRSPSLH